MKVNRIAAPGIGVPGIAVAAGAALLLAGCSGTAQNSAVTSAANPDATLVVGMTADPTQLVPWTSTSVQSQQLLGQLYSPLLALDTQSKVIANLADLPQVSGDGLNYTFALKQGVKFSGGSDLTSEDVKYTFDKIKDPATKATSASYFASVATVDAPDPKTVVVHLKAPDASFVTGLTNINTSIVPSDVSVDSLSTKPDGSGPFQFVSRNPNESISLKRNPNYFGGKVGAGNLTFRIIPDKQAMVSALKSGSVQVAIFDDPVVAKTATTSKVEVKSVDSLQIHVLQLRATSPDLSDVNRRLAIQCAVSRQDVVNGAALGAGSITGPITSPQFRSDPNAQPCPTQDLTKAKEYLAKAGVPNGFSLKLITSQGLYSTAVNEAQAVQDQLGKIGITVNVETLDSNSYVQRWLAADFSAAIAANGGSADPNTMYARFFTSKGSFNKVTGYTTPELDALFAQGVATADQTQRQAIYKQISEQMVTKAPWVWLFTPKDFIAVNTSVQGFEARTDADLSMLWKASASA